jgi:YD repeat-containing protein
MKTHMSNWKTSVSQFVLNLFKLVRKHNFASRAAAILLMTAILTPILLLAPEQTVSASPRSNPPVVSAPPESVPLSPSSLASGTALSTVFAASQSLAGGLNYTAGLLSAPTLPEGFEVAKPVSPAFSFLTSVGSSVASVFGFFIPSSASATTTNSAPNALLPQPSANVDFDFDNDGKADIARWKSSATEWKVKNSSNGSFTTTTIGSTSSDIAPGDFDNDGKTDAAVFTAGVWTIKKSSTGTTQTANFGTTNDKPVVGDYDGNGRADCAIFRPSTNTWWVLYSSSTGVCDSGNSATVFGNAGDITAQADYDGDGKTDYALYRPSTGDWHILGSTSGYYYFHWGVASDIPVPADYDGDGKTDKAVYRGSSGVWYIYKSSSLTGEYIAQSWGNYGDQPVPADYDGDSKADISVWRPTTGVWQTIKSYDSTYDYQTLGMAGEKAISSAYLKQIGGQVQSYDFVKTRLSPKNATGGTNLYSRNYSWGTSLVGLSGRAGLNTGFGISYNSLIWTKHTSSGSSSMYFDADASNVTPGFRFGFPTIEPIYYDGTTGKFNYLMVTPSGGRVEFRQIGASDTYETGDSTYTQLKTAGASTPNSPVENITITITGTGGTQMFYSWKGGAFRCNKVKDRNGNYIDIYHDDQGLLKTVTDTLGRVVTVNYDNELYPTSITQNWQLDNGGGTTTTHTYATFAYTSLSVNPSFDSAFTVYGPTGGTAVKVLDKIIYGSTTSNTGETRFEYNNFGQVKKIRSMAADGHELNYVKTNLESPGTNLQDVPRLSQTKSWAEDFNGGADIIVNNSLTESVTIPVVGGTGTLVEVSMTGHPNSAVSKTYVGSSGWMESFPIRSEDWADSALKKWTQTEWTQDNTSLAYVQNPRTTKIKVGDSTNVKRTEIDYLTQSGVSQVSEVRLYDDTLNALKKTSKTYYNWNTAYLSRRIIGLPSQSELYDANNALMSKVTYGYDEENFTFETEQNITPIKHDTTNYGTSFVAGRGNLTSTTRHDVLGLTSAATSKTRYDIAGSPVATIDAMSRKIKVSYVDKFKDNTNRNTYAYPTKVTDAADNYSEVKYRFDTGLNVWAKSPTPQGSATAPNSRGKETVREYDDKGRLEKETIDNTGAYTRYTYSTSGNYSAVYSTLVDVDGDSNIAEDEVLSESWTDGAGKLRFSRTEHPGSDGGYSGVITEYDILGRVKRSTVPTEINSSWAVDGDDETRGFLWTSQEYDWKGRVTRIINSDSNGSDGKDRLFSYDGCGCAGGLVTTIQSESVPRDDIANTNGRRTQKIYEDILGRNYKTVVLKWDGTTPYTTTEKFFNGRDQVTETRQYDNTTTGNPYQSVFMTYDGHGRMASRHYPVEDSSASTSWTYNADDSIQIVTDPRGAATDFTYNSRGLVTQINYTPPSSSTIPDTPTVTLAYDNAGNRISMDTAGVSDVTYTYDELSRMNSETVNFDDLTANQTIEYGYHLGGVLKSIKDPFNAQINYTNDKTGRISAVGGSPHGADSTVSYTNNIKYRAFGGIKQMDYTLATKTPQIKLGYDNRLRVNHSEVTNTSSSDFLMKADFSYAADSRVVAKDDLLDDKWDRTMKYDFAGRLNFNQFGMGLGSDNATMKRVYEQSIAYDAYSQMTTRGGVHWDNPIGFAGKVYINGRLQADSSETMTFNASGNVIYQRAYTPNPHNYQQTTYDTAGRRTVFLDSIKGRFGSYLNYIQETKDEYVFDGDGRPVISKKGRRGYSITNNNPPAMTYTNAYQVWSTVLGSSLTTVKSDETKVETKVFAGESVIAVQGANGVLWKTADPVTGTTGSLTETGGETEDAEPLGQKILKRDPTVLAEPDAPSYETRLGSANDPQWQCEAGAAFYGGFSGMPFHCQKKALFAAGIKLPWEDEIGHEHAPPPAAPHSSPPANDRGTPVIDLSSTTKPSEEDGERRVLYLPASSVPYYYDDSERRRFTSGRPGAPTNPSFEDLSNDLNRDFQTLQFRVNSFINPLPLSKIDQILNPGKTDVNKTICEKMVIDPLKSLGLDLNDFADYLKKGANFYDANASSIGANAGLGRNFPTANPFPQGTTIAMAFVNNQGFDALTSYSLSQTKLTMFFNANTASSSVGLLFHEALHGYGIYLNRSDTTTTGSALAGVYSDDSLKTLFGLTGQKGTKGITEYIDKYCGDYFKN